MTFGYLHFNYAQAMMDIGQPVFLPAAEAWILKREIPGSAYQDATGCYPLFACQDWQQLPQDFAALKDELVSLTVVTDPLGDYDAEQLGRAFTALVQPYKQHFLVDLSHPLDVIASAHHRRNAKQALARLTVEQCQSAVAFEDWVALYSHLIQRHQIEGVAAFSRESLAQQWRVPGLVAFRAVHQGETVGMTLWYRNDERAYYHLAAYSPLGYELKASFALFWHAIESFASAGLQWLALGAGAGVHNDGTDGLTRFKRGWATTTRTAYLCGHIFDRRAYAELAGAGHSEKFFPLYRHPNIKVVASPGRSAAG